MLTRARSSHLHSELDVEGVVGMGWDKNTCYDPMIEERTETHENNIRQISWISLLQSWAHATSVATIRYRLKAKQLPRVPIKYWVRLLYSRVRGARTFRILACVQSLCRALSRCVLVAMFNVSRPALFSTQMLIQVYKYIKYSIWYWERKREKDTENRSKENITY